MKTIRIYDRDTGKTVNSKDGLFLGLDGYVYNYSYDLCDIDEMIRIDCLRFEIWENGEMIYRGE
jgi:hypothetical protein